MMNWQYLVKAIYAAAVTFLGALLAAMQASPEIGFALSPASWVTIALATLVSLGGVLGLQAAPASVATSVKDEG